MKNLILTLLLALSVQVIVSQTLAPHTVDNSTYEGKIMFGYQGWFAHPDDNSARPHWWHWGNLSTTNSDNLNVEMYPDLREFGDDEKYPTGYTFSNGQTAPVFSSGNRNTVLRHMKWLRDYDVHGVFVQRFISEYGDPVVMEFRDEVTAAVKDGCQKYGRVFAIMYDGVGNHVNDIKNDWMHLVDDEGLTSSSRYLRHRGRPLVSLWGYTFYDQATVDQLVELIDWFHNSAPSQYRASIKLGLNDNWFNKSSAWLNAFDDVEIISPWSVGRYSNQSGYNNYLSNQLNPGKSWCDSRGIIFAPVIFPGFSWYNLKDGSSPKNEIPRNGGNFYWMQSYGAINAGCNTIYVAMFDELDEATAMFKTAENASQAPAQNYWLNLNADGYSLPSDWYLRCASKTNQVLRGRISNSSNLGTPPQGLMTIRPDDDNCSMTFIFPNFSGQSTIEISLNGGSSYAYSTPDNAGSYTISGLVSGTYDVYVRHPGSQAVPMGEVKIFGNCSSVPQTPYKTHYIPGTIQIEDFDNGGEGKAYHDNDATNNGNAYRTSEGVDIQSSSDAGGGYNIGWTENAEWLEYTINSITSGTYNIEFRVASPSSTTKSIAISLDGNSLGSINVPNTGDWQAWQTVQLSDVSISGGSDKVLRLTINGGDFNFNYVRFTAASVSCISSFPYNEGFESGLGGFTQNTNDDFDWTRNSGGTPSNNTGPSGAASGTYYMYTEASDPNNPNKRAILHSPCFDLTGLSNPILEFQYHMYGADMGTMDVQASTNGGSSWTTLWTRSGNQGNSWQSAQVDLNSYTNSDNVLIRFNTINSGWASDFCIDDIEVKSGQAQTNNASFVSQSVPSSMQTGETTSVSITMRNTGTTTWSLSNGHYLGSQNPQDNTTWGTNRAALSSGENIAPNQEKIFTFNITAPTTEGDYNFQWRMLQDAVEWFGDFSNNMVITVSSTGGDCISSFPYSKSFETGFGGFTQNTNDDFDWTRNSGGTPSNNTGPSGAADGSYYLYTEASNPNNPNKRAIITSPCFDFTGISNPVFEFQYHMYGADLGTMDVQVGTNGGSSWTTEWSRTGDQGNNWQAASVDLTSYTNSSDVLIRFNTINNGWASDFSIDDIEVKEGGTGPVTKTVGSTSVFGSTSTSGNRRAMPYTMPEDGTIESISMYHTGGSGNMILAVYEGSGEPTNRLGVTPTTAVSGSTDWQTINLTSPVSITSGTQIWLAWVYESNPGIRYESGSPGRYDAGEGWSGGMPDPFGGGSQGNYLYSIYATYTATKSKAVEFGNESFSAKYGNLKVYPNPVNDMLYIIGIDHNSIIEIYNITGEKVLIANEAHVIDVSGLSSGLYIVKSENGLKARFVKK